jgi:type IV fimbrial biogenesis protein FimT
MACLFEHRCLIPHQWEVCVPPEIPWAISIAQFAGEWSLQAQSLRHLRHRFQFLEMRCAKKYPMICDIVFMSGWWCSGVQNQGGGMKKRQCAGFTLIEFMFVVAIMGILLMMVMPDLSGFGHGARLSAYSNKFLASVFLARSEAIKRNSRVTLCKSNDGASCASDGDWSQGWMVFSDPNNNAQRDADEPLLMVEAAMPDRWLVSGNAPVARFVSYSGAGSSHLVNGAFQAGTITICRKMAVNAESSRIVINSAGRPRTIRVMRPSCP